MALVKQIQFRGIDENGNVFCQPLLGEGLEKTAAPEMRSKLHPKVQDFVSAVRPTPAGVYVLVNALGAGEYWGSNVNGDLFPEDALIHAPPGWDEMSIEQQRQAGPNWEYGFPTFLGAYPYKHHVNKDPSRAFGRVEVACWNPEMHRVELVVYLDRALCKKFDAYDVIERVERGEFPDVSMGCKVPYDVCTICQHKSKTRADYCEHAATSMNKILPDGRKVAVRNDHPKFFDISFVFIGADKTAKVMAKLASKGNQVCMGDFCTVPRPSADLGEVFSPHEFAAPEGTEKAASLKHRAKNALIGAAIGGVGNAAGSHAFDRLKGEKSRKKMKDEASRDGLAGAFSGALAGALFPMTKKAGETCPKCDHDQVFGGKCLECGHEKTANDPIKKKVEVQGVPIHLEWLKGETREYKDHKTGKVHYRKFMKADYGYIPETKDADGEEIDVYLGPDVKATTAYVIKQLKSNGKDFDENKVMVGYASEKAARDSYDHHMGTAKERFGGIASVPVSSLRALFGENGDGKEKAKTAQEACQCGGGCCGTEDKLAAAFRAKQEKSASHRKLSEILKSIPAGPFTRETLPKLEKTERDIPQDVLDLMGGLPLGAALSTPAMMGIVLKPREFQRVVLVRMGDKGLADELDSKNMTFGHSSDVDESLPVGEEHLDNRLKELLSLLGLVQGRSAAAPVLRRRVMVASCRPAPRPESQVSEEPVMKKLAAAYNGYRRAVLKKAASISQYLTLDPQLSTELFGESMAQAFAGGIDKVASASVFGPDSLAYLVGAYTDRDFHVDSKVVLASLAHTGAVVEAA